MVLPLKVAALSIACVSMAIFGPLESNWSAWQPILAKQGAYDDRCKHEALDEKGMCPSQREALAFLPTFSTSAGFVFALAGGIVKDRYGNRTAVLGGCVLKLAGMIILSISGRTFAGWAWGFFLLGAGDQPIMMGVVDVAHYFPRHKGLIIGVVTLFRNIAVLLPFGVELLVGRYPYTLVLLGYFYIMQLVFLFFVFGVRNMGQFPKLELKSPKKKSLIHTITDPAMWFVAGRPWYIVYASCYMCIAVMVAFYQTSSSYQLGMSIHSAPIYSTLTSLVLSPFFGLLVDNFGVVALTVGTAFPLSLSYLCMTFNHVGTDWAANSMEPIFRSVDRAQVHMVMAKRWPVQLQGRIVGICFAAGGLLGMASPLLLDVAIAGGIQIVNYVFFALSLGVCVALMLVARQYLPDLHKFVQRFAAPDVTVDSALKLLDENFLLVHGRYGFKTELSEMTESADETSHSPRSDLENVQPKRKTRSQKKQVAVQLAKEKRRQGRPQKRLTQASARKEANALEVEAMTDRERQRFVYAKRRKKTLMGEYRQAFFGMCLNAPVTIAVNCSFALNNEKEVHSLGLQLQYAALAIANRAEEEVAAIVDAQVLQEDKDADNQNLTPAGLSALKALIKPRAARLAVTSMTVGCPSIRSVPFFQSAGWTSGISFDARPFWEVFDLETVVVLSPDASESLDEVEEGIVYVIGGIVDRTVTKHLSVEQAVAFSARTRKFPLEKHTGHSAVLNIDTCVSLLLHYRQHRDWVRAFQDCIPSRQKRGTSRSEKPAKKAKTSD